MPSLGLGLGLGRGSFIGSSGSGYTSTNTEVATWYNTIVTNGGSVQNTGSSNNLKAVDTFVTSLKNNNAPNGNSLWSCISYCGLLCAVDDIQGITVPLQGAITLTNNNFPSVASGGTNYDRLSGLTGDGSTMYISSNLNDNQLPLPSNKHMYAYVANPTSGQVIGTRSSGAYSSISYSAVVNNAYSGTNALSQSLANSFTIGGSSATGGVGWDANYYTPSVGTPEISWQGSTQGAGGITMATSGLSTKFSIFAATTLSKFNGKIAFWSVGTSLRAAGSNNSTNLFDPYVATLLASLT
jgi:hypothetical protein